MKLYEEIIFLKFHFKGKWVVENVKSYYKPLIEPIVLQRHYFWANFNIPYIKVDKDDIRNRNKKTIKEKYQQYGFDLSGYSGINKRRLLNNCVNSELGLHIFEAAFKKITVAKINKGNSIKEFISIKPQHGL